MRITLPYRALRTLIIGPPGSGKGTISARMCRDFDMFHLSSGDLLRSGIQSKTSSVGVAAKKYVEAGELVPDEIMVPLILSELKKIPHSKNWVLDGFPRSSFQVGQLTVRAWLPSPAKGRLPGNCNKGWRRFDVTVKLLAMIYHLLMSTDPRQLCLAEFQFSGAFEQ